MAKLLITSEGFHNQVIELRMGLNRLGRSSSNDFQIEHATVSAHHCEILLQESGLTLRDCGSTNGTFLLGMTVKNEVPLLEGQTLRLGDVELRVDSTDFTIAIPKIQPPKVEAPPIVLTDGSMVCPHHPEALVTHQCTHCFEVMCDACVHYMRRRGGKLWKLCPRCSHQCQPLGGEKKKRNSFLEFLQRTVKLPFAQNSKKAE